jgi:hypothetical protein
MGFGSQNAAFWATICCILEGKMQGFATQKILNGQSFAKIIKNKLNLGFLQNTFLMLGKETNSRCKPYKSANHGRRQNFTLPSSLYAKIS